jgi:hypothetical protein
MSSTTRFPDGVTNVSEVSMFADLRQLSPTQYHTYWEDFDYYTEADWSGSAPDASLADADGGVLDVVKGDAGSTTISKVGKSFQLEVGKRLWMECRFKVADVDQGFFVGLGLADSEYSIFGFAKTQTYVPPDPDPVQIQGFFIGTAPTALNLPLEDDTYIVLGASVDELGVVRLFVNGQFVTVASGTNPPAAVAPSFGAFAITGPQTLSVDYFLAVKER